MQLIYILGLEHSGSTLTNHLLCQHAESLGLGEIASFFSASHMDNYMNKWGTYDDCRLCSCGLDWDQCEFWRNFPELNGLRSNSSLISKYAKLMDCIPSIMPEKKVVVDSSKSIQALKEIIANINSIGLDNSDIHIVFVVKDARSFANSIRSKNTNKNTIMSYIRTLNWWLGENRKYLKYLVYSDLTYDVVLYENLCDQPKLIINNILNKFDLPISGDVNMKHSNAHIAMGNKNFALRNSTQIKYDSRWFMNDSLNWAYMLHKPARKFNRSLYEIG